MTRLVSALALVLVLALTVPVFAQQPPAKPPEPAPAAGPAPETLKTKEDCEKVPGMWWRKKAQKCIKAGTKTKTEDKK